jgi:hypothetical protein
MREKGEIMSVDFSKLYDCAEGIIIDIFKKYGGYIDDWYKHGYISAVYDMYVVILEQLVDDKYHTMEEVNSATKKRSLRINAIDIIYRNNGSSFGFKKGE